MDGHGSPVGGILVPMRCYFWRYSCLCVCVGTLSCTPVGPLVDAGFASTGDVGAAAALDAGYPLDVELAGADGAFETGDAAAQPYDSDAAIFADAYVAADANESDEDSGVWMEDAGTRLVSEIDHEFLIYHFGGNPVDASSFADDESGFQAYLDAVGVTYFDAAEIVTPSHPQAAADCGYMILLPDQGQWEKIGALALFADRLRELVGEPVWMRNWWRPDCYNAAVGGAPGGDHPDADAVDLDFLSATSRAAAQAYLCSEYWLQNIVSPDEIEPDADVDPRLNMSVGLGGATIHLGVLSRNGRRFWTYGSYTQEANSGSCW